MATDEQSIKNLRARIAKSGSKINSTNISGAERAKALEMFKFDRKLLKRITQAQSTDSNN